jgi:hypothetical protein
MRRLLRLSLLVPLLCTGAIPAATGGCSDSFGIECVGKGKSCNLVAQDCCDDLTCQGTITGTCQ